MSTHARGDMGPSLTGGELTWHQPDRSDPRKAKWTRERAGAFVFVECHTPSRRKPVTGPGRALKLGEECVGIASAATSDVSSNILIADYFLDLGSRLSAEKQTRPADCGSNHGTPTAEFRRKVFTPALAIVRL